MNKQAKRTTPRTADDWGGQAILSVINYDREDRECPGCEARHVLFNAMDCRKRSEGGQVVIRQCKDCLTRHAEENALVVSIKTTCYSLGEAWTKNRVPEPNPGRQQSGLALGSRKRLNALESSLGLTESDSSGSP